MAALAHHHIVPAPMARSLHADSKVGHAQCLGHDETASPNPRPGPGLRIIPPCQAQTPVSRSSCHESAMELCSLHPFDESLMPELVTAISGDESATSLTRHWTATTIVEARNAVGLIAAGQARGAFE